MKNIVCIATIFVLIISTAYAHAAPSREGLIAKARALSAEKKFDEAMNIYKGLVKKDPNDLEAATAIAAITAWQGDYEQAIKLYNDVLTKRPNDRDAMMGLARVYHYQGNKNESLKVADRLLEIYPADQEAMGFREEIVRVEEPVSTPIKHFELSSGFNYQKISFTSNAPGAYIMMRYNEPGKWSVWGGFDYINKYGDSAPGYRLGGTYWPTTSTTLSLATDFAPKQDVVPLQGYTFEVSQRIGKQFVPFLGYRFADYRSANVHMVMPGLTWYFYPRFDWIAKYFYSLSRFGGANHNNSSMMTRISWNVIDPLFLFAGYARASESFDSGNPIDPFGAFHANHVFGGFNWDIHKGLGVSFSYDYEHRNTGATLQTFSPGFFYRW